MLDIPLILEFEMFSYLSVIQVFINCLIHHWRVGLFGMVLKFGTLFLFQSHIRQTFLALRRKCKSFYLNNHWIGLAAHSQHFFFTLFINVGEVALP